MLGLGRNRVQSGRGATFDSKAVEYARDDLTASEGRLETEGDALEVSRATCIGAISGSIPSRRSGSTSASGPYADARETLSTFGTGRCTGVHLRSPMFLSSSPSLGPPVVRLRL
jgi:hypothetical protein